MTKEFRLESAIGFAKWIVDDLTERANALEEAKSDIEMVASLAATVSPLRGWRSKRAIDRPRK